MVVFILEKVPRSLRGELTRWLLEPQSGVFVGKVSGMVRDRLWGKVCASAATGGAILCHSADTEQGFELSYTGRTKRSLEDFEGLWLVRTP